jgi:hypothetical protein
MTFIAGISDLKSCILTADNVVTTLPGTTIRDEICTTTGVIIPANMDDRVFKIMYPLPNCIMSFAGRDKAGYALAKDLQEKSRLESKEDIENFLKSHTEHHRSEITAIFGIYDNIAQRHRLLKWDSNNPGTVEEDVYLYCGSGSNYLGELAREFSLSLTRLQAQTTQKAAAFSCYFNQKLFHTIGKDLAYHGVGGCFYGMALEQTGLLVQEDTAIIKAEIIPTRSLLCIYVIKVAYRKGILFINSSLSKERKAYINSYNCTKEAIESAQTIARDRRKGLDMLNIDFKDLWDLSNTRNIEVHFDYDNIPSFYMACDPGEYLSLDDTRTKPIVTEKLHEKIINCIKAARI